MVSKRSRKLVHANKQSWVKKLAKTAKHKLRSEATKEADAASSENLYRKSPKEQQNKSELSSDLAIVLKKVPAEYDENAIRAEMSRFGDVLKVFLVRQKPSNLHCGTCFVYFREKEAVQKIVDKASRKIIDGTASLLIKDKKVEVHQLRGCEKSGKHSMQTSLKDKPNADTRNLYLLMEGRVDKTVANISKADRAKRDFYQKQAFTKLRNPNHHVSKTRLSVKNIPFSMDVKMLKQLFREFGAVKQGKILVDKANQSKECGFIEFYKHDCALNALRKLNNNPNIWGEKSRPIIAFAIDDITVLQQRSLKRKDQHVSVYSKESNEQALQM